MTTPVVTTPAVRVLLHDATRNVWVVHHVAKSKPELDQVLRSIPRTRRVRCEATTTRVAGGVIPAPPATEAQRHREAQAARMSDLHDENKRYKTPGLYL